jgi:hypothetical protein
MAVAFNASVPDEIAAALFTYMAEESRSRSDAVQEIFYQAFKGRSGPVYDRMRTWFEKETLKQSQKMKVKK